MKTAVAFFMALLPLLASCSSAPSLSEGWQSMGGPSAREITTLFAEPGAPDVIYAALRTGDVFRSTSAGEQWTRLTAISPGSPVYRFIPSVDTPTVVYAATSAGLFAASPDRRRWDRLPLAAGVRTLVIDPWIPTVLYAATEGKGIVKSVDNGASWSPANGEMRELARATVFDLALERSRPDNLFAAVAGLGIIATNDAGKTWRRLTEEFTPTGSQVTRVLLGGTDNRSILYATTSGNLVLSTDAGHTWTRSRIPGEGGVILSLEQSPANPSQVLAGTESGLYRSTDFGRSWAAMPASLPHVPAAGAFGQGVNGRLFAYGEALGLQRTSDNGTSWQDIGTGLGWSTVHLLTMDEQGTRLYAGLGRSVSLCNPATLHWETAGAGLAGDTLYTLLATGDTQLAALASTPLGVFTTDDGGYSWHPLSHRSPGVVYLIDQQPTVKVRLFVSGDRGLFVSTDQGQSWTQSKPTTPRAEARSFTFVPTNAAVIYASVPGSTPVVSRNGGYSWEGVRSVSKASGIAWITLDGQDASTAYGWTPAGSGFRTTNGGLEWDPYAAPWHSGDTVRVATDRLNPSKAVSIVNGHSLYYTVTGGATWLKLPEAPLKGELTSLLWNDASGVLYAGINHAGVYRLVLQSVIRGILAD